MTQPSPSSVRYQAGGSLPLNAKTYVEREADRQIFDALLAGDYCYVLNARQMGKSSLRIRTMTRLEEYGVVCAEIELSGIGSQQITAAQWYGGLIQELISGFDLDIKRRQWLKERDDLSPIQRLGEFIETVLLAQIEDPIAIFIDEIDSVLGLSFPTDEFFAFLRNCYEKRATKPVYQRLTFALLGVAAPSDLMQGRASSTPFNIGRAIALQGFQPQDCAPLLPGLANDRVDAQTTLDEILHWSGGQPFLTQKLCRLSALHPSLSVADVVQAHILKDWTAQDEPEHLRTIRDRLLRNARSSERLLQLCQRILNEGSITAQNRPDHLELRLSGLVELKNGQLSVKNPIYQAIFDQTWLTQQQQQLTPQTEVTQTKATIVFTDVVSFTAQMADNESRTLAFVQQDFQRMEQLCEQLNGQVIKSLGDGLLMTFSTAQQAVNWAIEIQKTLTLAASQASPSDSLRHRIGIHVGQVRFQGGDVLGTGVNLAARLQAKAPAGGICLSQAAYEAVRRNLSVDLVELGPQRLNGIEEPVTLYQIAPYRSALVSRRWRWRGLPQAIAAGLVAAGCVIGGRSLGLLENLELSTYDHLMRMQPIEVPDERLLIVVLTAQDVRSQPEEERGGNSLSDRSLSQLLTKLQQGNPRAIGLDLYREKAADPSFPELATAMAESDRFFGICRYGEPGYQSSPEISIEREGFNNIVLDRDDTLRRQVLAVDPLAPCQTAYSFAWVLALAYLADEGISFDFTPEGYIQLGAVTLKPLNSNSGGYHQVDDGGHQILLNYRNSEAIAPTISLQEALSDSFDLTLVQDRIVLIGTVAEDFGDASWRTPYTDGWGQAKLSSGVSLQGQMVSHLLSLVLDQRSLLRVWPNPLEQFWIVVWAILGGLISWRTFTLFPLIGQGVVALGIVYGTSWLLFCWQGAWIPLFPAGLALILALTLGFSLRRWQAKQRGTY